MLLSDELLRHTLPIARSDTPGAVAAKTREMLTEELGLTGVPDATAAAFCAAFEAFARAAIEAGIPAIYGEGFVERLACILFGRDPLLTLLCPQLPNRRILLVGERGSGKESLAHVLSTGLAALGGGRPIVAVNAAALPETLLESTLFGHVKGAFTGATAARVGLMDRLHPGGVLFFDEAGEASPALQAKLLRVFQTGEYAPVGAPEKATRADFHVVAATNASLSSLRGGENIRPDLLDRVAAPLIEVPPLRTLLTDRSRARAILQSVAIRVLRELGAEGRGDGSPTPVVRRAGDPRDIDFELWATPRAARIARTIEERTRGYHWPGNLREAAQMIRQSLFLGSAALTPAGAPSTLPPLPGTIAVRVPEHAPLKEQLEAAERELYTRAAARSRSINEVADQLGVARQTASRRLAYFGLEPGSDARASETNAAPQAPGGDPALGAPPRNDARPADLTISVEAFSRFTEERLTDRLASIVEGVLPPIESLEATVRAHLDHLRDAVVEHRFVDPPLAERIAAALIELANDLDGSHSETHQRLVAAAVAYFAELDDEDHDLHSVIGLDDDVRVVNEVAHLLGRDDLTIALD